MPAKPAAAAAVLLAALATGCSDEGGPSPAKTAETGPAPAAASGLGLNLAGVADWSREWAFVDVFKASRPWGLAGRPGPGGDAAGNPRPADGAAAWTLCCRDLDGHYPAGRYAATWAGAGDVDVSRWDVTGTPRRSPGRVEFDVTPANGGIQVDVKTGPAADFHVWMPGFEGAKSPFHPRFVERLRPARVLRFMDWQHTNGSPLERWADRPKPSDPRYSTDKGVPVEVMVALANEANIDPWFCLPHKADDEFVREFARLVKATLDPARAVYVEYSNEVWNDGFPQAKYAREQGAAKKLGDPAGGRFYAERSVQIFKVWEAEFGRDRLVRVLAAHSANTWLTDKILSWKDAAKQADALAVAPYFGHKFGDPKNVAKTKTMTPAELVAALEAEVDGENRDQIRRQAELARRAGLRLVAYEGGQHLVGIGGAENDAALTTLFIAANRQPRMYDVYRKHLTHWADAGGGLYALFNDAAAPSKWGSWGLLEYQDQPTADAPKYRAFVDAAAATK